MARLDVDVSPFLTFVHSVDRVLKSLDRGVAHLELPEDLVTIKLDDSFASDTGNVKIRIEPSEEFCGFADTLSALEQRR